MKKIVIDKDKIDGIEGWMDLRTCDVLKWLHYIQMAFGVSDAPDILEIGVHKGKSACALGQLLVDDGVLYACDIFQDFSPDVFKQNWDNVVGNPNLRILHISSRLLHFPVNKQFRIIHIDGSHTYYDAFNDMVYAFQHLHNNGVIIVDDFLHPEFLGVNEAIHRFVDCCDIRLFLVAYNKAYLCRTQLHIQFLNAYKLLNGTRPKVNPYYLQFHQQQYNVIL